MKILHLIIDHQVTERVLDEFEKLFPKKNDFLIFANDSFQLKHLHKYTSYPRVSKKTVKNKAKRYDFSNITHIIAHYLTFEMIDFIGYAPLNIHVCWDIYGADLYNQFLAPMGYKLQYNDPLGYSSFKARMLKKMGIYNLISFMVYGNKYQFKFVKKRYFDKISKRLNSIEVGCICDAKLLEKYAGRRFDTYKTFNYSLRETLGDLYDSPFYFGEDVLIGNSASLSNNHLYVLNYLNNCELGEACIVMPLSYGGVPSYKEEIMDSYNKAFPGKVSFILDYKPLYEYNKMFLRMKVMVMAAWRQESLGTITMGLYLGIKIYMSNKSPLYQSLKEEGFIIYEIERVDKNDFLDSLTDQQKQYNRNLLLNNYNESVFEKELKKQFN